MTIPCFNHLHIALMLISTVLAQQIQSSPIAAESSQSATTEKPMRALKMLGPVPLKPGQSNGQTEYFDPKTYSAKNLHDFHRLTQGLNADIRKLVEETQRIRQQSVEDAEELNRLRNWSLQDQKQWLLLLTGAAMAVAMLALALANLLLVKVAMKAREPAKSALLDEAA